MTVREAAAKVADLLELTYVPREPDYSGNEHCAVTALTTVCTTDSYYLWDELERRIGGHDLAGWSDRSGKETVVGVFREIARDYRPPPPPPPGGRPRP